MPTAKGTAGQVLTIDNATTGTTTWTTPASGGGGSGGITLVSEAQKNTMTSAATGTLVYQYDGYKGIYAKEFDGWRSQSGDTPIMLIDIGTIQSGFTYTGTPTVLNASHHTIIVEGNWDSQAALPDMFTLPAASACKGRIYSFYIINSITTSQQLGQPYEENGIGVTFTNTDAYIALDKSAQESDANRKIRLIPAHRQFAVQSDGTDWRSILNDKGSVFLFELSNNDGN